MENIVVEKNSNGYRILTVHNQTGSAQELNLSKETYEQLRLHFVGSTLPQWTDNDVDASYLIGCMNAGGLDSIPKEIERLKQLGLKPHEAVRKIRGKR